MGRILVKVLYFMAEVSFRDTSETEAQPQRLVISRSGDDSIVLYDCQEGKPKRTLYSKKYGVDLIRYTRAANTVVYSSNKRDNIVITCPCMTTNISGVNSGIVKLYDLRSFDKGPFATFKMQYDWICEWTGLKFSSDGKLILISTKAASSI
ncbi:hypothetical protein M91_02669 [Bos mutus]|uniref:Uncharacterized protein n=1 Tax=Bos mutus TaxID=72004 RepID=L8HUB6_9CETA|nr:hypothetical protein M91_02669 [Bos mutus]